MFINKQIFFVEGFPNLQRRQMTVPGGEMEERRSMLGGGRGATEAGTKIYAGTLVVLLK